MMVKDRGRPILDGIDQSNQAAVVDVFQGQYLVQPPPQAFEYLLKMTRRRIFQRHSPGKGAVEMGVGVDQARHDQPAANVRKDRPRVFAPELCCRTDFRYEAILDGHAPVGKVRLRFVFCYHATVSNQQQAVLPASSWESYPSRRHELTSDASFLKTFFSISELYYLRHKIASTLHSTRELIRGLLKNAQMQGARNPEERGVLGRTPQRRRIRGGVETNKERLLATPPRL